MAKRKFRKVPSNRGVIFADLYPGVFFSPINKPEEIYMVTEEILMENQGVINAVCIEITDDEYSVKDCVGRYCGFDEDDVVIRLNVEVEYSEE